MLAAWREGREESQATQERPAAGGRLVRVRNAYGEVQEYRLEAAPASAAVPVPTPGGIEGASSGLPKKGRVAPELAASPAPLAEFLEMPLVVRSGRGEYLGVGGRGAGPFSTADLIGLMAGRFAAPNAFFFRWEPRGAGWLLRAAQGQGPGAKVYLLGLEGARTPRGNDVVLVWSLEVDGKEVSPVFLHNFIRQMMDMAATREGES